MKWNLQIESRNTKTNISEYSLSIVLHI